jgi:hypothetical protein
MSRRITHGVLVFVAVFCAAQLIRPERANPATDPSRTFQAQAGAASGLAPILDRACRDCHSNATVWPSYAQIAPLSWLMAYAVTEGRKAVNFSEWGAYSPEQQRSLLEVSCQDVTSGKMPSLYTLVRPETRLSARDIATICAGARGPAADASTSRRQP